MAATKDNKKLILWGPYTGLSTYDLATTVWTAVTLREPTIKNFWGKVSSALDPTTGLIYFPEAANLGTGMLVYDPATSTTSIVPTYPSTVLSFQASGYSFVWSELRKSFLFFGGTGYINNMTAFNQYMIEYQPSTYSWTRIIELAKHCMIPAYGGTKMVVFGGEQPRKSIPAEEENFSSALYMLDVMTMNWTLLSEGEVAGRSSIACTVVGDNFVVWGEPK
ncbi:hypothetical protein BGZ97_007395 [Linnemannia gamsii]|uniref:Galactose oxidase n=1 Tax=Linnemannia gamsii TaxID=64522 RepID=A0A9P6REJ9_9FUNG|nr:hypothetical protein BGZ97_007395 [Linnemannia gamsii]